MLRSSRTSCNVYIFSYCRLKLFQLATGVFLQLRYKLQFYCSCCNFYYIKGIHVNTRRNILLRFLPFLSFFNQGVGNNPFITKTATTDSSVSKPSYGHSRTHRVNKHTLQSSQSSTLKRAIVMNYFYRKFLLTKVVPTDIINIVRILQRTTNRTGA